jgi:hypothetical protein
MTTAVKRTVRDILHHPDDVGARDPVAKAIVDAVVLLSEKPEFKSLLTDSLIEELMKQEGITETITTASVEKLAQAVKDVCGLADLPEGHEPPADIAQGTAPTDAPPWDDEPAPPSFIVGDTVTVEREGEFSPIICEVLKEGSGWLRVKDLYPVDPAKAEFNVRTDAPGLSKLSPEQVAQRKAARQAQQQAAAIPAEAAAAPSSSASLPPAEPVKANATTPAGSLDELREKAKKQKPSTNGYYVVLFDVAVGENVFWKRKEAKIKEKDADSAVLEYLKGGDEEMVPLLTILLKKSADGAPAEPPGETTPAPAAQVTAEPTTANHAVPSKNELDAASVSAPASTPNGQPVPASGNITLPKALAVIKKMQATIDQLHDERKKMARALTDQEAKIHTQASEIESLKVASVAAPVDADIAAILQQYGG